MKIYVVTSGEYSDYGIDQIFLTKEKAELYTSIHKDSNIEEYETYDDNITEADIYYIYTVHYFPETSACNVLPVRIMEHYNGIERLEKCEHIPRTIHKKYINLEWYNMVFINQQKFDEEKIKKIFFDKLAAYKAREEGID